MAQRGQTEDLSMEGYFNEGLADETEPNNPFELKETEAPKRSKQQKQQKKRTVKRQRVMGALLVFLVMALIVMIVILVQLRMNDGVRYAKKLAENIGSPLATAEKEASVSLGAESAYPTLNQLFASYQGIAESKKSCKILGVKLPEWAIFCNTDADELTNVTYYNYEVLEKNVFGTVRKAYLDPNLIALGATPHQVEEYLGLEPYRIQYLQGKTELREYRYCYADGETGDMVAYVITAIWDENGSLTSIPDSRKNYIGTLLASPEP